MRSAIFSKKCGERSLYRRSPQAGAALLPQALQYAQLGCFGCAERGISQNSLSTGNRLDIIEILPLDWKQTHFAANVSFHNAL